MYPSIYSSASNPFNPWSQQMLSGSQSNTAGRPLPATPNLRTPRPHTVVPPPPSRPLPVPGHHLPHAMQEYPAYPFAPTLPHLPPPSNVLPRPLRAPFVVPHAPAPPSYHQPPSALLYHTHPPYHIPTSASEHVAAVGPVPGVFPLSAAGWKDEEKLAYECDNWREYSTKVENQLGMIPGAARFLESTEEDPNPCPSFQMYPAHHCAWLDMDRVVRAFLSDTLTVTEPGQISALKRFTNISYASDPGTFAATTTLLTQCNEAIWQCGTPNPELFLLSGIISALEANHGTIVSTLLAQPNLDLAMAIAALDARQCGPGASTGGEAFAASTTNTCSNKACPKPATHTWPYCTTTGGGMAGKTVREAQTKYQADNGIPELTPETSEGAARQAR
ncbi:hypothetical protein B0H14DRAFT_3485144 [Mycena olivaceomarginata]|nr:hypothetical protein B0H14DRAFT_3485144 [Mycena olivaceomarginata]